MRVAVIGCGAAAQRLYAPMLRRLEAAGRLTVSTVVDENLASARAMAEPFEKAQAVSDLAGLPPGLSLAIIVTPPALHAEPAIRCLRAGMHVLCEKPMALTAADCDRMVEEALRAGRLLAVGHFRRFFPSCRTIKQMLDRRLLGAPRRFLWLEGEAYSWPVQSPSPFHPELAGGGVLMDAGVHAVDLIRWWLGDAVEVEYEDDAMGGVEANCRLRLRTSSGADGILVLSRDTPLANRCVVECEGGWVAYGYDRPDQVEWGLADSPFGLRSELRLQAAHPAEGPRTLGTPVPGVADCFEAQVLNVLSAIRGEGPLMVPGSEARHAVALIERCYRERRFMPMAWLPEAQWRRGRALAGG